MELFKRNKKIKIGLALGGGGARGFAHLGAIKAFEEYGLKFDFVCGTSAGSVAAAFLADGKTFDEMLNIAKTIKMKDIRSSKMFFMPSDTEGIQSLIKNNLKAQNVQDTKIKFAAVAVDLNSTNECIITNGDIGKAVAGSCAVPGVFEPVKFDDLRLLADGGLQDTIPAYVAKYMGCDYVIAVDVNPSRTYGTKSEKLLDVISCSIRILMKSNAIKGYDNADIMIKPDTKRFKSTKTDGLEEMIEEGYNATIDQIDKIVRIFSKNPLIHRPKKYILPEDIEVI